MQKASNFVLSSEYEGFPNALCEAMACGMAVVAMDCETGPREIMTSGVDGLLVPRGDTTALAEALISLAEDPLQRARLGSHAPRIVARFAPEIVLDLWRDLLNET
jgi:glycosyltransferase involved in cell wall biosynthesis